MLDGTKAKVKERKALRVNPSKTCQPIGAMYAALGIHKCMPHSHGSQGCCAYHRSQLTRHFKEPVMATTSSFTEGASVFGGMSNLTTAITNIFSIYDADVIAVHTTCLSEVIGDDIPTIIKKNIAEGKIPEGKTVFHTNTPSFVGSEITGFANMVTSMVQYFSESTGETKDAVNIIPGWVEPADMRELHYICNEMGVKHIMMPDTSDVLDTPQTGIYEMYPKGGVTLDEIKAAGDSIATISLGDFASRPAATELEKKCNVPFSDLLIPVGITNTDEFVNALSKITDTEVPAELVRQRGQLLDAMVDMSQYLHKTTCAITGAPDHVIAMTQFAVDLGMVPKYCITGTPGKAFERRINEILEKAGIESAIVRANSDLHFLHQHLKNDPVDLLIGNTHLKHMSRAEGIPLVRFGFPIMDRMGHRYMPTVGYRGGLRLLEKITDAILQKKDDSSPEHLFELVM
ncbi:nitrogenase molybdenum-iron protein subunit beta [Coraliomargarita akajimensis]|uniref:Nitrogenase molybdenum-iron protein beta chain n=1 Tax=Coraliomargarita akajimensis (strain DSM 45221 / IAM 15411 / JCM 23193 / KCTC 12865 / 04OKA010-24) TaxID=583355 RepID=D5EQN6_CORAD|nr:nitrogenase molybdenum-iron protein subunit beta [Coraliomargarita akajimensis]ADE55850.1 nitrogenase molybdenum-iron protein beta chain [Coraliomargarita akajimensis DSM 45221]